MIREGIETRMTVYKSRSSQFIPQLNISPCECVALSSQAHKKRTLEKYEFDEIITPRCAYKEDLVTSQKNENQLVYSDIVIFATQKRGSKIPLILSMCFLQL